MVATTQLAVEQTEMIKAGRLRALAVLSDADLIVAGMDPVPPITKYLPDMPSQLTILASSFLSVLQPKSMNRRQRSGKNRS